MVRAACGRLEFQAALSERHGKSALQMAISWISALQERAGPLLMAAYELAGADQALRKAVMEGERARDLTLIARRSTPTEPFAQTSAWKKPPTSFSPRSRRRRTRSFAKTEGAA